MKYSKPEKEYGKKHNIPVEQVRAWSLELWRQPFEEERDRRAAQCDAPDGDKDSPSAFCEDVTRQLNDALDRHRRMRQGI